jgi:hypothetical protein
MRWPQWRLQVLEQFRQIGQFVEFDRTQHLPPNGGHFVL